MFEITYKNGNIYLENADCFDLAQTLDCGQAFRWKQLENGEWCGIAKGKFLRLAQDGNTITLFNTTKEDFENIWWEYFDLSREYLKIINSIKTPLLKTAADFGSGIRILRQDSWEALCSFIISQNNNIPRIKGIIERLCENFGKKIEGGFAFPTAEKIANLTLDDLAVLRSGFRAKYILDAAKKVAFGELNLEEISLLNSNEARERLMSIYGVGKKVADCAMLYGMGKVDVFPIDVWIKRALETLFNGNLPEAETDFAGIAQQYIFYYAQQTKLKL